MSEVVYAQILPNNTVLKLGPNKPSGYDDNKTKSVPVKSSTTSKSIYLTPTSASSKSTLTTSSKGPTKIESNTKSTAGTNLTTSTKGPTNIGSNTKSTTGTNLKTTQKNSEHKLSNVVEKTSNNLMVPQKPSSAAYQKQTTPNFNNHSAPYDSHNAPPFQGQSHPKHPLSEDDKKRQKIANANYQFVKEHPELVTKNSRTIQDPDHIKINSKLTKIKSKFEDIVINNYSTISTAIYYHNHGYQNIYVLNFADAKNTGGGYLNGRNAQEECLCRQTLLYPAIKGNIMYTLNQKYGPEGSDIMIYSPDVLVIRDDNYQFLKQKDQFKVNIISSAAVDNRHNIKNANSMMYTRIQKIVKLAASESMNAKGKTVLILGAFGCGVFKNDTKTVSELFAKVLLDEGLKDYFNLIVFPIYKGSPHTMQIFQTALKPAGKKL